jgi:hypothetical protein
VRLLLRPAIGVLMRQYVINPALRFGLELFIIQQKHPWDQAVEPIGAALPALAIATDPARLFNTGPELIQVSGETIGLKSQLGLEPATRRNLLRWQWRKRMWVQIGYLEVCIM